MNKERIEFLLQAAQSGLIHGDNTPNLVDIQQLCHLALWAIEAKKLFEDIKATSCEMDVDWRPNAAREALAKYPGEPK